MSPASILIIADSERAGQTARALSPDFDVELASYGSPARTRLSSPGVDVALLDLRLPVAAGAVAEVCAADPHLPVVVLVPAGGEELGLRAVREGAQDFLVDGRFDGQDLNRALRVAQERKRAQADSARQASAALAESEARYRLLFESNPQLLWVYDRETLRILAVNDAACRHYGYTRSEFLDLTLRELRPPEEVPHFIEGIETGDVPYRNTGFHRHCKKDGSPIDVEVVWHAIPFGGVEARLTLATDVTERRRLEDQLRQAQKMEAVGRLAGGLAHDFNNVLSVIGGYASLIRRELAPESASARRLEGLMSAADRAAGLTRQLLTFSRRQVPERRVLDLAALTRETVDMLRRLMREDIQLVTFLPEDLGRVRASPGQIEQVLMNLAVNARDAMPHGGRLTIEAANVELDEAFARRHLGVAPGSYVMLAVTDTGVGMDAVTRSHIFEPFFTTKDPGKGTGLGLATVYGIVQACGGSLFVYSEPGQGAVFKVYLPQVRDGAEATSSSDPGAAPGGTECILIVEDDKALREIGAELLEEAGYQVLRASNGAEALWLCGQHDGPLDLMLTDLVMPRLSGSALAEEALKLRPGLKIVYMSGYTDRVALDQRWRVPGAAFLEKPFTPHALLRTVRETLDQDKLRPRTAAG